MDNHIEHLLHESHNPSDLGREPDSKDEDWVTSSSDIVEEKKVKKSRKAVQKKEFKTNEPGLYSVPENEYGPLYKDHLLTQYRILVDAAVRITDRVSHILYSIISINVALFSFYGISSQLKFGTPESLRLLQIGISSLGLTICIVFYVLVRSYSAVSTVKYYLVAELEQHLPLYLYKYEWIMLAKEAGKKHFIPVTKSQEAIPIIFSTVHIALIIFNALRG